YNGRNWVPLYLYGTTPDFLEIRDWQNLPEGNPFSDQDVNSQREVCMLGQTIVRELFGEESPIGRQVRINNKPFTVVGTLARKGVNMMGVHQDDIVLAPWTTIKSKVAGQSAPTANESVAPKADPSQQVNSPSQIYPNQQTSLYPLQSAPQ